MSKEQSYEEIIASPRENLVDGVFRTVFVTSVKGRKERFRVHAVQIDPQSGTLQLLLTQRGIPTAIETFVQGTFRRVTIEPMTATELDATAVRRRLNDGILFRNGLRDEATAFKQQETMMQQRIAQKNRWVGLQAQVDGPEAPSGAVPYVPAEPGDDEQGGNGGGSIH
jgi:hypothetical protein